MSEISGDVLRVRPFVNKFLHVTVFILFIFFAVSWLSFLLYSEIEFKCLMAISAMFRYFLGLGHFSLALWLMMGSQHVMLVHRATPEEHVKSKRVKNPQFKTLIKQCLVLSVHNF